MIFCPQILMVLKASTFCVFNPTMSNISMGVKIVVRVNSWEEGSECKEWEVFDVTSELGGNMIEGVHCSHQITWLMILQLNWNSRFQDTHSLCYTCLTSPSLIRSIPCVSLYEEKTNLHFKSQYSIFYIFFIMLLNLSLLAS